MSSIFHCLTPLQRNQLLRGQTCFPRSKFFPLKVDPKWKSCLQENKQEVTINCYPLLKRQESIHFNTTIILACRGLSLNKVALSSYAYKEQYTYGGVENLIKLLQAKFFQYE